MGSVSLNQKILANNRAAMLPRSCCKQAMFRLQERRLPVQWEKVIKWETIKTGTGKQRISWLTLCFCVKAAGNVSWPIGYRNQ